MHFVNKRYAALITGSVFLGIVFLFSSCKKINGSTELGTGLIPAVDNITTFDTSLEVQAFNDTFSLANDSLRFVSTDEAFLGLINNDPLFGKTDARVFLQLNPSLYPFTFANKPDSLHIDSVVLILDYLETYGDSTIPQTVNVYELDQANNFKADSFYLVRQNNFTYSNLLGSKTFIPSILDDSIFAYQDTTKSQLRIRLDDSFGDRLLHYDSTQNAITGAYANDSVFRSKFKGFALQSIGSGNAIMGFNLAGANTKLAIYYKDDNNDAPVNKWDTLVAYFNFTGFSAAADYVQRNYSGTPLAASVGGISPDPLVYIQTTPGSFATIKIPGLSSLSNRVIHRAELIAEEAYDPSDAIFTPPTRLFLDAFDSSLSKYRTIPYDFVLDVSSGTGIPNLGDLGTSPVNAIDGSGNPIKVWHLNISRYIQHLVTHTQSLYNFRLYAPFIGSDLYGIPPGSSSQISFAVNPAFAKGRVRLVGGGTPTTPQRMRLHIIYSKL